jgi:hypothetical protein
MKESRGVFIISYKERKAWRSTNLHMFWHRGAIVRELSKTKQYQPKATVYLDWRAGLLYLTLKVNCIAVHEFNKLHLEKSFAGENK